MCLVLFAYQPDSATPLVVAANRDEFYARPAASAHRWPGTGVVAGRDLSAGGTWLGVSAQRRFATVTNFAEENGSDAPCSRGALVEGFLNTRTPAHEFAHHVHGSDYRGFNLLLWDGATLVYTSNRGPTRDLAPGVYGLANAELGAQWPKVARGVAELTRIVGQGSSLDDLLELLADTHVPPDGELPCRGRPLELERRVAPIFIRGDEYGTRASSALVFGRDRVTFVEQGFAAGGTRGDRAMFGVDYPPLGPPGSP